MFTLLSKEKNLFDKIKELAIEKERLNQQVYELQQSNQRISNWNSAMTPSYPANLYHFAQPIQSTSIEPNSIQPSSIQPNISNDSTYTELTPLWLDLSTSTYFSTRERK